MFDMNMMTYMVPVLYALYGCILLLRRPEMNSNMGFGTKYARKSEAAWSLTQKVAGVYALAAAAILYLCIQFVGLPTLIQVGLELALTACFYPVVNAIVKKKLPDEDRGGTDE